MEKINSNQPWKKIMDVVQRNQQLLLLGGSNVNHGLVLKSVTLYNAPYNLTSSLNSFAVL